MISFQEVEKRYGLFPGRRQSALRGMSLRVRRGECVALVGPNGAGKSTVIGLALGFLRPTAGRVRVGGTAPERYVRSRGAGYLPERYSPPPALRAREVLRRLALLEGLEGEEAVRRSRRALARVGLGDGAGRVRSLSRGNRQRLGIAQLLLSRRELLLLDEPWGGLDPAGRTRLRALLAELRAEAPGAALLVASHDLGQVARVADRALVLAGGRAAEEVRLSGDGGRDRLERRVLERSGGSEPGRARGTGPGGARRVEASGSRREPPA